MNSVRPVSCLVAFMLAVSVPPAHGQARDSSMTRPAHGERYQRPRIGLVLGGGGARGGAHIGVLRVLEELRVPVDAIAGTSMGAIVGALFAAGMSADEVERALLMTDWRQVLSARPDRRAREVRRKQDDEHLLVDFELGYRDGRLRVPGSVIGAHEPTLLLETLLLPVAHIPDHDSLPIPFRAVATDIGTGELVVLREGVLAQSVRASMSIPGAFPPVSIGGRLLVDGGILRNLPIDIALDMDVDVLIAVDVGTPLQDTASLGSAFDLLGQTMILFTRANADAQLQLLRDNDLHLQPRVGDVGTLDFHRIAEAIAAGESAAREAARSLRRLAIPNAEYQRLVESRRVPDPVIVIDSVRVEPVAHYSSRAIEGRVHIEAGDTLRVDVLSREIARVHALDVFQQVTFDIAREDSATHLRIRPVEKPWGPNFIRLGFGLLNASEGHSAFDLIVNYTMTGIGSLDADLRTEVQLGELRRIIVEYFQPVSATGRFFVAPWVEAREQSTLLDVRTNRLGDYDVERVTAAFDIGRQFGAWGQLRVGVHRVKTDAEPDLATSSPEFENAATRFTVRMRADDLDNVAFPTTGQAGMLSLSQIDVGRPDSAIADHARIEGEFLIARTRGPHTLIAGLEGRASIAAPAPPYNRFRLGGLFRLSGLEPDDITGDAAALVRLLYFNRTSSSGSFGLAGGLRIGASLEIGNAWNYRRASLHDLRIAGSTFIALDTLLGPLYLAYGIADRGHKSWYILLGQAVL